MLQFLVELGRRVKKTISFLGRFMLFSGTLISRSNSMFSRPILVTQQIYFLGNRSVLIIVSSGLFVGFVLSIQGYYMLNRYGSTEALGLLVALSLLRELGPVVSALLFAGRAGTALTAEIGLMKVGEQLIAMEVMAIDPVRRVLVPRFWSGIFVMPILATIFSVVGIFGGWIVGVMVMGLDTTAFWSQMQSGIDIKHDVANGILKSIIFGILITLIALHRGWEAEPTPKGVAKAVTSAVVGGSLLTLSTDLFFTSLIFRN